MPELGTIGDLLGGACLLASALGCIYLLTAAVMVLRFTRNETARTEVGGEPVTILKPLHGAEPGLSLRLRRFCKQVYPEQVQVICGIAQNTDLAARAIQLCRKRANAIELVVDGRHHGSNPKVSNLINMLPQARHDILIVSDSDIEVECDYVGKTAAALVKPGVGAVTCLYSGSSANGLWSQLSALAINSHFLPNAIFALTLGLTQPCFGATIALRRSMLRRIGGFHAFKDVLADDNAIGRAVRATGCRVIVPGFTVKHVCQENSLSALLAQDLRISRTIRSIDRIGYSGLVITHPFALALLAIPFARGDAAALTGFALASRAILYLAVRHAFKTESQRLWLIPFRDLLSFAIFIGGLLGGSVGWRGTTYRIIGNGQLSPDRGHACF